MSATLIADLPVRPRTLAVIDRASPPKGAARPQRRWSRHVARDLVGLLDASAVIAGSLVPALLYGPPANIGLAMPQLLHGALIAAALCCACLKFWGLYDTTRMHDLPCRPARLFAALVFGVLAVTGLSFPPPSYDADLGTWLAAWLSASFVLLVAGRRLAHAVLARLTAAGRFDERIAVFGAGLIARRVHDHLANARLGIHFVGAYDDRRGDGRLDAEGLTIAGRLEDLIRHAREDRIDRIVIALPHTAERRMAEVAKKLEPLPVSIHVVTHMSCDLIGEHAVHAVSSLGSVGLLDVKKKPLADWDPLLKRLEDYGLGALMLIASAVLFPLIALAIKLDSPGPVFFRQRRRGFNQGVFEVLKFRTMRVLEDGVEVRQCAKGDPRVTRVGRFLRRTSLDELPQLINVLRGEMSLVGPRPHALAHDDEFGGRSQLYALRHQVKPGLTGLAQVRGFRGETGNEESLAGRVEQDVLYVRTWSLWLDVKILAQTFWVVALGRNAH